MAAAMEEGLVVSLILAQPISNPALRMCRGCSCVAHIVHTTKCSIPICFFRKTKSQFNWPCSKIMISALWYGS